jgi:hypothetical protein
MPGPRPAAFSLGSSEAMTTRPTPASRTASTQGHVHRRPRRVLAAAATVRQRRPLGVEIAQLGVEALADDLTVADDHRADKGVGTHAPPPALGEGQRALQEVPIGG